MEEGGTGGGEGGGMGGMEGGGIVGVVGRRHGWCGGRRHGWWIAGMALENWLMPLSCVPIALGW